MFKWYTFVSWIYIVFVNTRTYASEVPEIRTRYEMILCWVSVYTAETIENGIGNLDWISNVKTKSFFKTSGASSQTVLKIWIALG